MSEWTHLDQSGNPQMVDVSKKSVTERIAIAQSTVILPSHVYDKLLGDDFVTKKGSVIQTAILAGIMAVKQTSSLIPLCHPLQISKSNIEINPSEADENTLLIRCTVKLKGQTGVEMEALTGASVAALTIYDMCKAHSHDIIIDATRLVKKSGGKSDFNMELDSPANPRQS